MTGITLLLMAGFFGLIWHWMETTTARDIARVKARRACKDLGVQLLDQTVALNRTRIAWRRSGGRTGIQRCFRFEFSETGSDRNEGEITLQQGVAVNMVFEGAAIGRVVISDQSVDRQV